MRAAKFTLALALVASVASSPIPNPGRPSSDDLDGSQPPTQLERRYRFSSKMNYAADVLRHSKEGTKVVTNSEEQALKSGSKVQDEALEKEQQVKADDKALGLVALYTGLAGVLWLNANKGKHESYKKLTQKTSKPYPSSVDYAAMRYGSNAQRGSPSFFGQSGMPQGVPQPNILTTPQQRTA